VLAYIRPRVLVTSAALFFALAANASNVFAQTAPTPAKYNRAQLEYDF